MTHWKKMTNQNYLGSYALDDGKDLTLTIREVKLEAVPGADGKREECIVCYWKEQQKPMILNRTNCKTIEKIYKTPHIEEWAGKAVTIYVASVQAWGEDVSGLRIRPIAPKLTKEKLPTTDPRWAKAIEAVKAGTITPEGVADRYDITPEQVAELQKAKPATK